jgi:cytochrome c oxidase subunit III
MSASHDQYYIPEPSRWPIVAMLSIFSILMGFAFGVNGVAVGSWLIGLGAAMLAYMFFGWFGDVVEESLSGQYNSQVDKSFRQGMFWFISSEVFFFATFFGSLYYLRNIAVAWLGGDGYLSATHDYITNQFVAQWPTAGPAQLGGEFALVDTWGVPALNTAILLTSGLTLTWAHWGLKNENRKQLIRGLMLTVALGIVFVVMQAEEYAHAYGQLNLTLESGVYGSTFYILTGFHGFHVIVGALMLAAILGRSMKGHFTEENHFAFEAAAWYWHFVDVVWLGLFVLVYWM